MDPPFSFGGTLQLFRLRACEELVVGQAKALYMGPTFLKTTPKRKKKKPTTPPPHAIVYQFNFNSIIYTLTLEKVKAPANHFSINGLIFMSHSFPYIFLFKATSVNP